MGSSIHRLEILLIGAIFLVAGSVVVALMLIRPPAQSTYTMATAAPVASATSALPVPPVATSAPSSAGIVEPIELSIDITSMPLSSWPYVLVVVGVMGVALTARRIARRRRMAYTGQNVGMLLATADAETRASNLRVLRDLQAQGQLPPELAAVAGLASRRRPALSAFKLAALSVQWSRIVLPWSRLRQAPRLDLAPGTAGQVSPVAAMLVVPSPAVSAETVVLPPTPVVAATGHHDSPSTPADTERAQLPAAAGREHDAHRDARAPDVPDRHDDGAPAPHLAAQEALPDAVRPAPEAEAARPWSADERALAVAATLADVWATEHLTSPVLAIDTASGSGPAPVLVSIDPLPDEEERLAGIPDRLSALCPAWHASWKPARERAATLTIEPGAVGRAAAESAPLIVPLLRSGRGGMMLRYVSLGAWRHLGLYGGDALASLHGLLTSILYMQPPSAIALAILDQGQVSPLYTDTPHRVAAPGDLRTSIETLMRALRRNGVADSQVRPLLLVVVEPDAEALTHLTVLLARLRQLPDAPLHLLLVQERLNAAGRELYAMLPALITAGGQGSCMWLPGQSGEWPRRGSARLVGRGMRIDGRPLLLTEAETAGLLAPLRQSPEVALPVLWEVNAAISAPALPLRAASPATWERPSVDPGTVSTAGAQDVPGPARMEDASEALPAEAIAPAASDRPIGNDHGIDRSSTQVTGTIGETLASSMLDAVLSRIDLALATPRGLRPGVASTDAQTAPATGPEEPDNGWPRGPTPVGRAGLATLMAALLDDAEIMRARQADQVGVTKKRLQALGLRLNLFPESQARMLAESLIVWFDRASILVMPLKAREHPLNQPRALERADLEWMRERLNATPLPDPETVRAAWLTTTGSGPAA